MAHRLYTHTENLCAALVHVRVCMETSEREREQKIVKKYKNKLGPYRYFLHVVFKATRKKLVSICNSSGEMGWAQVRKVSEVLFKPPRKKREKQPERRNGAVKCSSSSLDLTGILEAPPGLSFKNILLRSIWTYIFILFLFHPTRIYFSDS